LLGLDLVEGELQGAAGVVSKKLELPVVIPVVVANHKEIQHRFRSLAAFLDERMRRLVAAAESEAIGYGGVSVVARATGVSRRAEGFRPADGRITTQERQVSW
jgi:hypothetical protein